MKKKKNTITIEANKLLAKNGTTEVFQFSDGTIIIQNNKEGKLIKEKELLCHTKKSLIRYCGVSKDGKIWNSISLTPKELMDFAKKVIKAEKEWKKWSKKRGDKTTCFFKHLSPELSFFFKSKV